MNLWLRIIDIMLFGFVKVPLKLQTSSLAYDSLLFLEILCGILRAKRFIDLQNNQGYFSSPSRSLSALFLFTSGIASKNRIGDSFRTLGVRLFDQMGIHILRS